MNNIVDELFPGISTGNRVDEDLKLGKADLVVLQNFVDANAGDSDKLHSSGDRLDGHWMGGNEIARWEGPKIYPGANRPHGRADQTLLRKLKKMIPSNVQGGIWP